MSTTGAVRAIGALADPIRRRLYDYVVRQREAVSREEAADALSLPLTKAKFHLDRLANEGLLDIEYRRMSGREGPGAGRPSKLYRRASTEIRVSLPERRYDLMGEILAGAVVRSQQGEGLQPAIDAVAHETGTRAAQAVTANITSPESSDPRPLAGDQPQAMAPGSRSAHRISRTRAEAVLTELGYEAEATPPTEARPGARSHTPPVAQHDPSDQPEDLQSSGEELRLRNCPFDSLAQQHRDLVCGANQHFVQGVLDGAGCEVLQAHLEPHAGYCCVVVRGPAAVDSERG